MFLLDTNVVSELRKTTSDRADRGVVAWSNSIRGSQQFISVITLLELERGMLLVDRRDPATGDLFRRWIEDDVMAGFRDRTLSVDASIARTAAALGVPDPVPFADALLAATALVHGLALVTRNVDDFARVDGLRVINPWDADPAERPQRGSRP